MKKCTKEYENGSAKLYKFEEIKDVIIARYKENAIEELVEEYVDSIKEREQPNHKRFHSRR